ncbi:hypothetical protein DFH06DRAFT_558397 [Mycena polygramma]|nr:hypothetical protein DFH06DRAFT_558397 [Mycena polygramma]
MAEVVGLIASILQLVDLVTKARNYIKDFADAPQEQTQLLLEIQNLDALLKDLDKRAKRKPTALLTKGMQVLEQPLRELNSTLQRSTKKLESESGRIAKFYGRLIWPLWAKEDVVGVLNGIERFKSLVDLRLGLDTWDSTQEVIQTVNDVAIDLKECHAQTISALKDLTEEQRLDHNYIAKSVRDVARNQEEYHNSSERDAIIDWYSPLELLSREAEIFSAYQPGTGGWFLENDWIKLWRSGVGKKVWCPGMPGAGKTVLASMMVNDLRANLSPDTGVAVIYLDHKESDRQSPSLLLGGIWRQLVFRKSLSATMHQLYKTHQEKRCPKPSLDDIHSILCSTVAEHSRVFIVVDALDEYPEEQRTELLLRLSALGPNVNLMLTSRPHIKIEHVGSADLRVVEIRANEDDVRRYLDAQIGKSARLSKNVQRSPDLRGEIERRIIWRSNGMFLLVKLTIASLATKPTVKTVRVALEEISKKSPGDLNGMYDEVMERINRQSEDDRNLARRTLSWISNAHTVLHISELIEALAVEPGTTDLDPDNLLDLDIILSVCAGLVVLNEEDHLVRLIHYTAQEYLDRYQERHFPWQAQLEITGRCITYLCFRKFATVGDLELEMLFDENPLLEYALLFTLAHARGEPETQIRIDILRFLAYLLTDGKHMWQMMHTIHPSLPRTRIGLAAYFGMLEVASYLLDEDRFDIAGLRGAARNGHTQMVRLLMQSQGYRKHVAQQEHPLAEHFVDAQAEWEFIAGLHRASRDGNEEIVYAFLEAGVNVNGVGLPYGTALQAASFHGHYSVVCILLAMGADVNLKIGMYGTALRAASIAGHTDMAFLLIENGAQIDAQGKHGSALAAALCCGREGVAQLLIDRGANPNDPGARGWTALGLAAVNGYQEIVRHLLLRGANVNARSEANKTALHAAQSQGHEAITRLLIQNGAVVGDMSSD